MKTKTNKRIWTYVGFIGGALAVGAVSALISMKGFKEFPMLKKPPLSPPAAVFPIAWTALYALMGVAAARISIADTPESKPAIRVWAAQLIVNGLWTPIFFGLEWRLTAFVVLMLLIVLVVMTIGRFKRIDVPAGNLLLPYLVWLLFAAYLNMGVYLLNR